MSIRVEASPALPMGPSDLAGPQLPAGPEASGCATATITPGTLIKASVSLMNPPPPC